METPPPSVIDPNSYAGRVAGSMWIIWLFLFVGLAGLVVGAVMYLLDARWVARAVHPRAEVVDLVVYPPEQHQPDTTYVPVVLYTDADGKQWRHPVGSRSETAYKVGDRIDVVYAPGDPADAFLNTAWEVYGRAIFILALSGVLVLIAGVCLPINRAIARNPDAKMPWWEKWFAVIKPFTWFLGR